MTMEIITRPLVKKSILKLLEEMSIQVILDEEKLGVWVLLVPGVFEKVNKIHGGEWDPIKIYITSSDHNVALTALAKHLSYKTFNVSSPGRKSGIIVDASKVLYQHPYVETPDAR